MEQTICKCIYIPLAVYTDTLYVCVCVTAALTCGLQATPQNCIRMHVIRIAFVCM